MTRPRLYLAIAASTLIAAPAAAQSCGELASRLAAEMNLSIDLAQPQPPTGVIEPGTGEQPTLTEQLADTGGVIEPPPVGAPAALEPPPIGSDMPTAPPMPPQTAEGEIRTDQPSAARRIQLEGVLAAAHAAAERGDEAECMARLAEAQQIAAAEEADGETHRQ